MSGRKIQIVHFGHEGTSCANARPIDAAPSADDLDLGVQSRDPALVEAAQIMDALDNNLLPQGPRPILPYALKAS
jgi:hypothetical protein